MGYIGYGIDGGCKHIVNFLTVHPLPYREACKVTTNNKMDFVVVRLDRKPGRALCADVDVLELKGGEREFCYASVQNLQIWGMGSFFPVAKFLSDSGRIYLPAFAQ